MHNEINIISGKISLKAPEKPITIPNYAPPHYEIARQMRIDADNIKKEISDHVDSELKRFREAMRE